MFSAGAPRPAPGPTGPNTRNLPLLDELPPGWPSSLPPDTGQSAPAGVLVGVAVLAPHPVVAVAFCAAALLVLNLPNLPRSPRMTESPFPNSMTTEYRDPHDTGVAPFPGATGPAPDAPRDQPPAAAPQHAAPSPTSSSSSSSSSGGDADFDMDAYLAQREEATGRPADQGTFRYKQRVWTFTNPVYADDDFTAELERLEGDTDANVDDLIAHYMGEQQADEFRAAGGGAMTAMVAIRQAVQAEQQRNATATPAGRPTQPNRSSRRRRNR